MASASVKIISDTVAKRLEAGHPLRNHSTSTQSEVTPFPSEDGACRINHHSPRDKSKPGPEGRTPEAGGRALDSRKNNKVQTLAVFCKICRWLRRSSTVT